MASASRVVAIALIVAGVAGLAVGTFSYTKDTHDMKVGPLEMSVHEQETVNIPVWGGAAAIGIGAVLLLLVRTRD